MNASIEKALNRTLDHYASIENISLNELPEQMAQVFRSERPFMNKIKDMDSLMDDYPRLESLREILFDLLLMNFFSADVERLEDDYLESEEWEIIEDQTIDRGTELLNLLLYLRECKDENIDPDLSDFLVEFLLVDEDEFQDEHRIYEPIIENQMLAESDYAEISRIARTLDPNDEITALFYPIMSFFNELDPSESQLEAFEVESTNKAFDGAVYTLLSTYLKY